MSGRVTPTLARNCPSVGSCSHSGTWFGDWPRQAARSPCRRPPPAESRPCPARRTAGRDAVQAEGAHSGPARDARSTEDLVWDSQERRKRLCRPTSIPRALQEEEPEAVLRVVTDRLLSPSSGVPLSRRSLDRLAARKERACPMWSGHDAGGREGDKRFAAGHTVTCTE